MVEKSYKLGKEYIDKGNPKFDEDQFMRWLNIKNVSGMMNSPGIRWLNYAKKKDLPAAIILISKTASSSYHNPWEDVIDRLAGKAYYWGDSKYDLKKSCEDFMGNKLLKKVHVNLLEGNLDKIPPILLFSKPVSGKIFFEGLCVLENLERTWFEDKGKPVRNYRAILRILDTEKVKIEWIHNRIYEKESDSPSAWKDYSSGKTPKYLKVWNKRLRSKNEQLPPINSNDDLILKRINSLLSREFEFFTVRLLESIKDIKHEIVTTRAVRDKGFDFFGRFTLPYPLKYEINFKGEAKKFARSSGVGPKELSRLAAKLTRGEYGIFITTSYYTLQAQEELFEDDYPIKLISGNDIINFLKESRMIKNNALSEKDLFKFLNLKQE